MFSRNIIVIFVFFFTNDVTALKYKCLNNIIFSCCKIIIDKVLSNYKFSSKICYCNNYF